MSRSRLVDLPPELVVQIAWATGNSADCSRFARANRRLFFLLEPHLFRLDVRLTRGARQSKALNWALSRRNYRISQEARLRIVKKSIQGGANVNIPLRDPWAAHQPPRRPASWPPLRLAADRDDIELAKVLVDAGAHVNAGDANGNTALMRAIERGSDSVMEFLVQHPDQDLQRRSSHGDTMLTAAVRASNLAAARLLLPRADPNEHNANGRSALFLAVSRSETDMVSLLLSDARLQPELTNILPLSMSDSPITAFAFACGLDNLDIVEMLHDDDRVHVDLGEASAAVRRAWNKGENIEFLLRSKKSRCARLEIFRLACEKGQVGLAKEALQLAGDAEQTSCLKWLEAAQGDGLEEVRRMVRDKWRHEILFNIADHVDNLESIRNLCLVNKKSFSLLEGRLYRHDVLTAVRGSQALRWTLRGCNLDTASKVRIANKSIAAGASLDFCVEIELPPSSIAISRSSWPPKFASSDSATPAGAAAASNCIPLIQTFLEAGDGINRKGRNGLRPIYLAVSRCCTDAVRYLLDQSGIRLGPAEPYLDTLLSVAVQIPSIEIAEMLLPRVDPNQYQMVKHIPLYMAIDKGDYEMVSLLLSSTDLRLNDVEMSQYMYPYSGAMVDLPRTPFAHACNRSSLKIVQLLHDDSRVDVDICIYGKPPISCAIGQGDHGILNFLLRSEKSTTARAYAFGWSCKHQQPELALQVIQFAGDSDKKHAKKWIRYAEKGKLHSLVEEIRKKWRDA
ncbi:hypothetical protein PWT90_09642 [Aphanocladium album]|nr:hypothetical protein PWT90_09642 [Aphanocladium album]